MHNLNMRIIMLSHILTYYQQFYDYWFNSSLNSKINLPETPFPLAISEESAELFQRTLMDEFDKALVDYVILAKLNKNIHIEKKLTPDDRRYSDIYYQTYRKLQTISALIIATFLSARAESIRPLMALNLSAYTAAINMKRGESVDSALLKNFHPRSIVRTIIEGKAVSILGLFAIATSYHLLSNFIKIFPNLLATDFINDIRNIMLFYTLSLLAQIAIDALAPLISSKISEREGRQPSAISTKMQLRLDSQPSKAQQEKAKQEMLATLDVQTANEYEETLYQIEAQERQALADSQQEWKYSPDSPSSNRYLHSKEVNLDNDTGNKLWLPGYYGNAENQANKRHEKCESEDSLQSLEETAMENAQALEDIVDKAILALPKQDQEKLSSSKITRQIILFALIDCYPNIKADDIFEAQQYDFLFSIIKFAHVLLPVKQKNITENNHDWKAELTQSNIIDAIGNAQHSSKARLNSILNHGIITSFTNDIRNQKPLIQLSCFVDSENFLRLVKSLSQCKNRLFKPSAPIEETTSPEANKKKTA